MDNITVVMLCAGRGTRMLPLTEMRPKPLQEVLGKNLIEWKLEALPSEVREVILVIGYQGEQIRDYFGDTWKGKTMRYIVQNELNGTGGALLCAKPLLGEQFLVMMGDDLYDKEDIEKLMMLDWGICVKEVFDKEMGAEMLVNADGTFAGIVEERHYVEHGLVNTGLYMLSRAVLDIPLVPIGASSKEFGLPQALAEISKHTPIQLVKTKHWMQITTTDDLVRAETEFFR